jgi:antitoxin (DNA-binding transcriptional repressor) of toxin-antitoxin stability system
MISTGDDPVARLTAERTRKPRRPGSAKGKLVIHDNFDDSLPDDLLDLFEGNDAKLPGD